MHPIVKLAKDAVEGYIIEGKAITPPEDLRHKLTDKAGVFVSIKKGGELRGCIGTCLPATDNVATEIVRNAISAATSDPRFLPINLTEFNDLEYSVDILSQPEEVAEIEAFDPKKYGVIVKAGNRQGLLLPDLEGINTVEEQIRIAMLKAGISQGEDIKLYRFEVKRYK